jgi:uncharacterized protein (DUF1499 family)
MSLLNALTRSRAFTHPGSDDPRLRGRAYPIPFVKVWEAVLQVARTRRRWTVVETHPATGELYAEARSLVWRFIDDVWIRVSLDAAGQTRVDVTSASRVGRADLGANARRIARFLHALDRHLRTTQP